MKKFRVSFVIARDLETPTVEATKWHIRALVGDALDIESLTVEELPADSAAVRVEHAPEDRP